MSNPSVTSESDDDLSGLFDDNYFEELWPNDGANDNNGRSSSFDLFGIPNNVGVDIVILPDGDGNVIDCNNRDVYEQVSSLNISSDKDDHGMDMVMLPGDDANVIDRNECDAYEQGSPPNTSSDEDDHGMDIVNSNNGQGSASNGLLEIDGDGGVSNQDSPANVSPYNDDKETDDNYYSLSRKNNAYDGDNIFLIACRDGNTETIIKSIAVDKGLLKIEDDNGWTALIVVCFYNQRDCLAILLKAGANVNLSNEQGARALSWACHVCSLRCMRLLLNWNAEVNFQDKSFGFSPIMAASESHCTEAVELLILFGANVNICNVNRSRGGAQHYALIDFYSTCVTNSASSSSSSSSTSYYTYSAECSETSTMSSNTTKESHTTAYTNKEKVPKRFKGALVERTKERHSVLVHDIVGDKRKMCDLKIGHQRNSVASRSDALEGNSILIDLCTQGEVGEVNKLLLTKEGKESINYRDGLGNTALHHVIYNIGCISLVSSLLSWGASTCLKNKLGQTPMHVACIAGNDEYVRLLSPNIANLEDVDIEGWTALRCAVFHQHLECCKILIYYGADVHASANPPFICDTSDEIKELMNANSSII